MKAFDDNFNQKVDAGAREYNHQKELFTFKFEK